MYQTVQKCQHCGANLTLDDMRKTNCPYCGTVFPHHSMAAQHAEMAGHMMNNMMGQQAQIQNQWRGAFGVPPQGVPGAPPTGTPGSPYGAPYGSPYGDPNQIAQAHMANVQKMSRNITMIVMVSILGVFLLVGMSILLMVVL